MARPISSDEAMVVRWLLEHRGPTEPEVVPEPAVDDLIVVASCACGCRSVGFVADRTGEGPVRDALARLADDAQVGIILWASGQVLTGLEIHGGAETASRLPHLSELQTWEQLGEALAQSRPLPGAPHQRSVESPGAHVPRAELLDILQIGHDVSMRGAGLSLREALGRTRYRDRRPGFDAADLRPLLEAHAALVEVWIAYCEDKRTSGGWYINRSGEIGQLGTDESRRVFATLEEAVAEYVVRELDFWSSIHPLFGRRR